jgi:hypothetical protein
MGEKSGDALTRRVCCCEHHPAIVQRCRVSRGCSGWWWRALGSAKSSSKKNGRDCIDSSALTAVHASWDQHQRLGLAGEHKTCPARRIHSLKRLLRSLSTSSSPVDCTVYALHTLVGRPSCCAASFPPSELPCPSPSKDPTPSTHHPLRKQTSPPPHPPEHPLRASWQASSAASTIGSCACSGLSAPSEPRRPLHFAPPRVASVALSAANSYLKKANTAPSTSSADD